MAAKSNHPGDLFLWIIKVIKSCQTTDQLESVYKLMDNFYIRCGITNEAHSMRTDLHLLANRQWDIVTHRVETIGIITELEKH